MSEEVVPDSDRLGTLEVRVTRHDPTRMAIGLSAKSFDHRRDLGCQLARGSAAVEAQVQRDLVVARSARMQRGSGRGDLGQAPLDRRVDVLVRVEERERSRIELPADPAQASLDGGQLRGRDDPGGAEATRVSEAAGDVEWVELIVGVKGRGEALELREKAPLEATAPQLFVRGFGGYFPSRLTSPNRLPRSRACRRPWTWADVRTPMPQSLMNPAAADWSNSSPLPYVASDS
jgi:hypothetical protein